MKKILESNGHTMVGEADNGEKAIKLYGELLPDLVILDITMPGMSGIEVMTGLKVLDPNVKVIICSSMGQQSIIAEAIRQGAKDFVVKPFKEASVVAAIEKVLAK